MKTALLCTVILFFSFQGFGQSADDYLNHANEKTKLKNFGDAIENLNKAISLDDQNMDGWFLRGTLRMLLHDYQTADSDLNKALTLKGSSQKEGKILRNNSCINCHLGYTSYKLDNPIQAISFYNEALNADPKRGEAYYRRGLVKLMTGQKEDAGLDFRKALDLNYKQAGEALKNYFR